MDTHIKEGQLYVQHQKFGKVSPLFFFCFFVCFVCSFVFLAKHFHIIKYTPLRLLSLPGLKPNLTV